MAPAGWLPPRASLRSASQSGNVVITGTVNAYREAIVHVMVRGPRGQIQEIEALVDTGFNGSLSLPPALVTTLGLPFRRRGRALLADGSESLFDIYEANVTWDGRPRRVSVDAADTDPLVGMTLLEGYELAIQAVDGGEAYTSKRWWHRHNPVTIGGASDAACRCGYTGSPEQYNPSYTLSMKTAISIPDELFESAEQFARRGMSRSELYATALRHCLREHRSEGIIEQLDEIHGAEPSVLDPAITRLQARSLPNDAW